MKASELNGLLKVLRLHKVAAFEMGVVKVNFHPMAFVDEDGAKSTEAQKRGKPKRGESAPESEVLMPGDDPDLAWSVE